jgi:hypothetical protein
MKKTIVALGLGLCGLILCAGDASAWGWFRHHNRYQSVIICRPYNAFTPVCYGNMICDGCCPPLACNQMAMHGYQPWAAPGPWGDPCCMAPGAGGHGVHGVPAALPGPGHDVTPPPPLAAPGVTMAPTYPGIQPAAYQPYYYPGYYYPMMPAMPTSYGYPMPYYGYPQQTHPGCNH